MSSNGSNSAAALSESSDSSSLLEDGLLMQHIACPADFKLTLLFSHELNTILYTVYKEDSTQVQLVSWEGRVKHHLVLQFSQPNMP